MRLTVVNFTSQHLSAVFSVVLGSYRYCSRQLLAYIAIAIRILVVHGGCRQLVVLLFSNLILLSKLGQNTNTSIGVPKMFNTCRHTNCQTHCQESGQSLIFNEIIVSRQSYCGQLSQIVIVIGIYCLFNYVAQCEG